MITMNDHKRTWLISCVSNFQIFLDHTNIHSLCSVDSFIGGVLTILLPCFLILLRYFVPQALHSLAGPHAVGGPFLHCGVFTIPQLKHPCGGKSCVRHKDSTCAISSSVSTRSGWPDLWSTTAKTNSRVFSDPSLWCVVLFLEQFIKRIWKCRCRLNVRRWSLVWKMLTGLQLGVEQIAPYNLRGWLDCTQDF